MRILVFESNLMWSSRLLQSLRKLGHEPVLMSKAPESGDGAEAAIVNLGATDLDPVALAAKLHELEIPVVAHAGHKEKELHALGREAGVDILATNSELTFKLESLLDRIQSGRLDRG
ncbi:MAG TPA: hypothetical protein VMI31_16905 [Fimbriimonadaceae bacterium]|nr:hypothetical protein [Fimbriimonadaceae bacterium]